MQLEGRVSSLLAEEEPGLLEVKVEGASDPRQKDRSLSSEARAQLARRGRPPVCSGRAKAQDHPAEGASAEKLLRMLLGRRRCPGSPGPGTLASSVGVWPGVQPA